MYNTITTQSKALIKPSRLLNFVIKLLWIVSTILIISSIIEFTKSNFTTFVFLSTALSAVIIILLIALKKPESYYENFLVDIEFMKKIIRIHYKDYKEKTVMDLTMLYNNIESVEYNKQDNCFKFSLKDSLSSRTSHLLYLEEDVVRSFKNLLESQSGLKLVTQID